MINDVKFIKEKNRKQKIVGSYYIYKELGMIRSVSDKRCLKCDRLFVSINDRRICDQCKENNRAYDQDMCM